MPTIAHMRGSIAGAMILTIFGGLWCIVAVANWAMRPSWSVAAGAVVTVALLAMCVVRLVALSKFPSVDDPAAAAKGKRIGMLFGIIFGIEGGAIAVCSTLLVRHGLGIWIPFAVGIIVGLHFLPLASVFEVPLYYWTGGLSTAGALGCLLIPDSATRVLCVGMVMAAVLWLSVVVLLVRARRFTLCYNVKR